MQLRRKRLPVSDARRQCPAVMKCIPKTKPCPLSGATNPQPYLSTHMPAYHWAKTTVCESQCHDHTSSGTCAAPQSRCAENSPPRLLCCHRRNQVPASGCEATTAMKGCPLLTGRGDLVAENPFPRNTVQDNLAKTVRARGNRQARVTYRWEPRS